MIFCTTLHTKGMVGVTLSYHDGNEVFLIQILKDGDSLII